MSDGIYAALSGGVVQLRRLDVLANDLANVNTTGFKRDRLIVGETAAARPDPEPFGAVLARSKVSTASLAETRGTYTDLSQGPTVRTDGPLDVALVGEGFLAVEAPGGLQLTRDGRLALAADGTLVTQAGLAVSGEWGPVTVPSDATSIEIQPTGEVLADGYPVGRLRIVRPTDPGALEKLGHGLWDPGRAGVQDGAPAELVQGFLEGSNVEPVTTLVELIQAQRSFDASQQMIRAHKDMDATSLRKIPKT
jgi:flagellar basal-body rod protein FlgG